MKRTTRHDFAIFVLRLTGLVESTLDMLPEMPELKPDVHQLISDMVRDHFISTVDPDSMVHLAEDIGSCPNEKSVALGIFVDSKELAISLKVMERDLPEGESSDFELVLYQDDSVVCSRRFRMADILAMW